VNSTPGVLALTDELALHAARPECPWSPARTASLGPMTFTAWLLALSIISYIQFAFTNCPCRAKSARRSCHPQRGVRVLRRRYRRIRRARNRTCMAATRAAARVGTIQLWPAHLQVWPSRTRAPDPPAGKHPAVRQTVRLRRDLVVAVHDRPNATVAFRVARRGNFPIQHRVHVGAVVEQQIPRGRSPQVRKGKDRARTASPPRGVQGKIDQG